MVKCGEVKVTKHVFIFLRKHSNEVLCDMVHMDSCHLLLGRLWQYDRKAIHDGFRNRYTLVKNKKSIPLVSLSLKQVYEDLMQTP